MGVLSSSVVKFCPILSNSKDKVICNPFKCDWWDKNNSVCAVMSINESLKHIAQMMEGNK